MAKGSIEKRGANTWRLRIDLGYNPDGTRNRPSKPIIVEDKALLRTTKKLQDYLDDELAKFKQEVLSGQYVKPSKIIFKDFVEREWKPKYGEDEENLSPGTLLTYLRHLKNHIMPVIGHMCLEEITTMILVNMMDVIKKPGGRKDGRGDLLEPGTVNYIHRVAKNVFERAVEWKLLNENPMNGVPKSKKANIVAETYYDDVETQEVIDALYEYAPTKWRLYCLAAILGGYRRGEITALQWSDADFKKNTLRIDETISLTRKGKAIVGTPKTVGSKAIVDMPVWYMEELLAYRLIWENERETAGDKWLGETDEYIFHGGYGKPYYYTYPYEWWAKFLKRYGIRHIPFHGLRHTMATLLLEDETDTRVIQERLRHTQHSTTTGIYAHVTKKLSRVAANKLERFNPRKIQDPESSVPNSSPIDQNEQTEQPPIILH